MPIISFFQYGKLLIITRKSGFMDSNLLRGNTLLTLVAVAYGATGPPTGLLTEMLKNESIAFFCTTSEAVFCSNKDSKAVRKQ